MNKVIMLESVACYTKLKIAYPNGKTEIHSIPTRELTEWVTTFENKKEII